jgi:SPP1 gp7 family putative phage head morphogenesis protein
MSSQLYTATNQFRSALLARDALAARQLTGAYVITARRIRQQILQLGQKIEQARAAGERISPSWLYQQQRLASLLRQVQNEIIGFAGHANTTIEAMQREAAQMGLDHAETLFILGSQGTTLSGGFAKLPAQAATDLVGFAADGSPLSDLLANLAPGAADAVKQALFSGIVRGAGAEAIAREVYDSLGGNMARALLIARTETLRAYRESSQRFYESNADVVNGWRWVASLSLRTCEVCWAMNGSEHSVDEQFSSHPGCRCTPVPITDMSQPTKTGPERFAALPEAQQQEVLGPLKFEAYKAGRITLQDLVGASTSRRWGMSLQTRSLKDALADPRGQNLPRLPKRSSIKQARRAA